MSLIATVADYNMPDDFGGIDGDLTYPPSTASRAVVVVSESAIRTLRQNSPKTGNPTHAAIRPKSTDGSNVQGFEIVFWPTPNADAQLSYKYYIAPAALSNETP